MSSFESLEPGDQVPDGSHRCSSCGRAIARCLCLRYDHYDADELGIDPDAKWADIEHQGFLIGPGNLNLPRLPNA